MELDAAGTVLKTFTDSNGPEGVAVLPDGRLIVAQQAPDRLDLFDPPTGTFSPWLQLGPVAPGEGVDGLGVAGDDVLVPDSAHGRLLRVVVRTGDVAATPEVVAAELGRPVAVATDGGGGYFVAVENEPGLVHVIPGDGTAMPAAHLGSLDDVVLRGGLVYATDLADGSLVAIDGSSGASRTLVSSSPSPQGLAATPEGDLLLVNSSARELVRVRACG